MSSTWVRSADRKSIMPCGSGSSSGELVAAGTGVTVVAGLAGTAAATGTNGLREPAGRSVPAAGSPAGPPGRLIAGAAFGAVFALAGLLPGGAVAFAAPWLLIGGPACGGALLGPPVGAPRLFSRVRLPFGPKTSGGTPAGSPVAKTTFVVVMVLEALVLLEPGWPFLPENGPPPATPLTPPPATQPEKLQFTTVAPPKLDRMSV